MLDPLSVIAGATLTLLGLAVLALWLGYRSNDAAVSSAESVYECRCGQTFYAEQPAKDHAVTTHNAPPQADEWRFLYAEGG